MARRLALIGSAFFLAAAVLLLAAPVPVGAQGEPLWARAVRPLLARQVPGLQLEGLSGTLTRDPRAARITLSDTRGAWLVLEDAGLVIDRGALFRGNIRLEEITAARGVLVRLPEGEAATVSVEDPPPDPQGVLPTLPQLSFGVQVDRIAIGRFELGEAVLGLAAALSVQGRITLTSGRLEANFSAERLDAPGALRMQFALDPAANRLQADVVLDEPPGGLIGTAAGLRDQPASLVLRLDGPASGARLEARGGIGPEVSLTLAGTVRAAPGGSYGASLEAEVAAAPLLPLALRTIAAPFALRLDAALSPAQRLTLTEARFTVPAGTLRLSGVADLPAGTLDMAYALAVGESTRFAAFVPATFAWRTLRADGRVVGTATTPRVVAEVAVEGFASTSAPLAALLGEAPTLALDAMLPERIERLAVRGAAVTFDLTGRVAAPLDATARLSFPDLSVLGAGFTGALRAELRATGSPGDPGLDLSTSGEEVRLGGHAFAAPALTARIETPFSAPRAQARLSTRYADLPLTLDVLGHPEGRRLRLERAAAVFGPARIEASGLLDLAAPLFEGSLRLNAPDLAPLSALAGMPLSGGLRIAGDFTTPEARQGFDLRAELAALRAGPNEAAGSASIRGTTADGELRFDGTASGARLRTHGVWHASPEGTRVTLPALEARYRSEAFRLATPARFLMRTKGGVSVEALRLAPARGGTLDVSGGWNAERLDITATLNGIPARLLTGLAAAGTPVEGTIGGRVRATGSSTAPDWQAALRATGLRATAPWAARVPAAEIRLDGSGTGMLRAELRAAITAGPALRLSGIARLPGGFAASAPLVASLDGTADLGVLARPYLASGADRVTGRLALALRAQGSLGNPQIGGDATLSGGSYRNPVQGIALTDIAGALTGQDSLFTIRRLTARTPGGGSVALQGSLRSGADGIATDIAIQARNARPIQSEFLTTTLDADLTLTGTLPASARLAGAVNLTRTEFRLPERMPLSVRTIPNVRERGVGPAGTTLPAPMPAAGLPPIALALRITAPRAVFVRGRGVDAELAGAIDLEGTLAEPAPRGGFDLRRGTLRLLDRQLSFQQGRIAFNAGTLTPGVDLQAESRVREVTVRVNIEGPATDPRLTFSSTPELPQDEILARLLFERSARELSPFQIASLAQAAAGLAGYQGTTAGGVLDRVRRTLALDRLSVGSARPGDGRADGTNAAIEGGRYVAEGVYLGVRQGATGGPPRVGVQIDILPRVRVEAETGGNSSAGDRVGLSYEVEY